MIGGWGGFGRSKASRKTHGGGGSSECAQDKHLWVFIWGLRLREAGGKKGKAMPLAMLTEAGKGA